MKFGEKEVLIATSYEPKLQVLIYQSKKEPKGIFYFLNRWEVEDLAEKGIKFTSMVCLLLK